MARGARILQSEVPVLNGPEAYLAAAMEIGSPLV